MHDVQSIRHSNPIADIVAQSGVTLRRLGQRLTGRCPFHSDAQPSLVVYPQDANYFCFGCGAGGDVIDFVARLNRVGFHEAVRLLVGDRLDEHRKVIQAEERFRIDRPTDLQCRMIDAATRFYHECLWSSPPALAYLALRGIDRQTARVRRIGYGAPGLAPHLRRRGYRLDDARSVGLLIGRREAMLGRIIVPELHDGRATWLTGRTLDQRTPRYLNLRLPTPLLGVGDVRERPDVIITEGVFDWLTIMQWGLPGVALLGTRISKRTVDALRGFTPVYIALDSDEAGQRASAELAASVGPRSVIVELPPGVHDVNDLGCSADCRRAFERCLELNIGRKIAWETTDQATARIAA
jgi:DNA primase